MTQRDIRDIAAYWNTYTAHYEVDGKRYKDLLVDWEVLKDLDVEDVKDFKLLLRPISSLTDEERRECAKLAKISPGQFEMDDTAPELFWNNWGAHFDDAPINNPGAIITYLQSIGVYVPGTINPDYVQLI